jgi:divalent metal cation (Fe/Co/Zn/Cd) transporter
VFAICLETLSLRTAVRESRHVKPPGQSWWQFIRRTRQPELPVVLLEDIGAEVGLFMALVGVTMAGVTDDPRWDALGSIAIGALLVVIAIILAIEMKGLLIGEGATPESERDIVAALTGADAVRRVIHLKTQHLGPDELLVAAKLEFDPELTMPELAAAIDSTEARVRHAVPIARVIYLEPDLMRTAPA